MDDLEKAKLLSVASKLAKAEIDEVRSQLIEQINSIKIPEVTHGRDGRSIVDARILDENLVIQFSDGTVSNLGRVIGEIGVPGIKGDRGVRGEPGVKGDLGPRGDVGPTGPTGKDGEKGARGDKGDKGDRGDKGEKGDQGERGEQGPQGIPGERGERGERGEQGPQGIAGTDGRDGTDGKDGRDGKDGAVGRDGAIGPIGPQGEKGDRGDRGDKGDPGDDADVSKLEKKLEQFTQDIDRRVSKIAFNAAAGGGPAGSGEVLLHRLDDVDYNSVRAPTNGQALVYNSTLGKWQANTVSGGGGGLSNTFATTVATQTLIPTANIVYNLGSSTARYKDLWLANSTIYLGSAQISASGSKVLFGGIAAVSNSYLTSTFISNTTVRSLINQKMSVANTKAYLANTNAYIATKVNTTTFNSALANTNAYIASVAGAGGGASWSALTSTNTALRSLISDRLQVANAVATYQTKAVERAALANTNAYIATRASWSALTSTNTAIRALDNQKLTVSNSFSSLTVRAANTAAITTVSSSVKLNDAMVVNPAGHLQVIINGVTYKIPYFL
jgi:hypothetical protein